MRAFDRMVKIDTHIFYNNAIKPPLLIVDHPARFKVVAAGRRFGKSYLSMNMMARTARHPMKNVCTLLRLMGQPNIMWFLWKDRLKQLNWSQSFHEVAMQAHLVNGSVIALKGTNNPDSLRGVGLDYLVIDESAFIDERTWTEVLRPTLSDKLEEHYSLVLRQEETGSMNCTNWGNLAKTLTGCHGNLQR